MILLGLPGLSKDGLVGFLPQLMDVEATSWRCARAGGVLVSVVEKGVLSQLCPEPCPGSSMDSPAGWHLSSGEVARR